MPLWSKSRANGSSIEAAAGTSEATKVVLHVGCGEADPEKVHPSFRGPEWRELRLDIDPSVKPDIVGSMVSMPRVKSDSVDAVWSSHNLEHVFAHEVSVVLREFRRVLRPRGVVLINVPDLQKAAEAIITGNLEGALYRAESGAVTPLDVLYGHGGSIARGNEYMAHRTGFTAETLEAKLVRAGFEEVVVTRRNVALLWGAGRKPG